MRKFAYVLLLSLITTTIIAEEAQMDEKQKLSYAIGVFFSQTVIQQNLELDNETFLQAISDMLEGKQPKLSQQEMQAVFADFRNKELQKQNAVATKNLEAGKKFLAENKNKEGVVTTASGLQYKVIKAGDGNKPSKDASYTVHYRGTLIDGSEFDSSYARQQPITLKVNGVIPGWQEALPLMSPGAKWQLFIPPELGYGAQGQGKIPPQSTLIFDVQLLSAK